MATSVASDYNKIRSMFRIAHKERENIKALRKILNQPVIELTESVLSQLSVHHDRAAFNETHPKAIFASWFYTSGVYHIYSELEVEKKNENNEKGRVDLLLTRRLLL